MGPVTVEVFREEGAYVGDRGLAPVGLGRRVPGADRGVRPSGRASDECGFLVGQTFPIAGGWVQR